MWPTRASLLAATTTAALLTLTLTTTPAAPAATASTATSATTTAALSAPIAAHQPTNPSQHSHQTAPHANPTNPTNPAPSAKPTPAPRGTRYACPPVPRPGFATCFSLVRTGLAAHRGLLAPSLAPPGYSPLNLQHAYDLPSTTAGRNQTIAVVDAYDDPQAAANLAVYRAEYKLPACTVASGCFRKVAQDGTENYPHPDPTGGWEIEESIDLDMVSAACPNCRILLVEAASSGVTSLGQAVDEAVKLGAKYVSNSYGGPESRSDATLDGKYYDHPGVAVTVSSGDLGYGVQYPAASPYVTAVGGTSLLPDRSTARGWEETAWSQTGSGCSAYDTKPSWQHDSGCQNRTVADVSAVADPATGVAFYDSFEEPGWGAAGGTSVAAPIVTATYALAGPPKPGSYPAVYPYADTTALNHVTGGPANGNCDPAYLCTAGPGYDGPTGWGTPHGVQAFRYRPYGDVAGTVTGAHGHPLAGANVTVGAFRAVTDAQGSYNVVVPTGTYRVTAGYFGYATGVVQTVQVKNTATTTESFALHLLPSVHLTGTVTDGSGHGWPLYAQVSVAGAPASTYTDPATGRYQLTVPAGASYQLSATPLYAGYLATEQTVEVGEANVKQDFRIDADTTTCDAPGYGFDGTTQSFDQATAPQGWTVHNLGSQPGWTFSNPGGLNNPTGGSGNFAIVPSAYYGWNQRQNTELISPVIDMSGFSTPVVRFNQSLENGYGSTARVDLSTDGGSTWTTVWTYTRLRGIPGPDTQTIALPSAAGRTDVRIRFHDVNPPGSSAQFWALDNVFFGNQACAVRPGGLVQGMVTDGNTGAGIGQATVTVAGHPAAAATSAPGRGFYYLFAPAGQQTLRAAAYHYMGATAEPDVRSGGAATADFTLQAGRLVVSTHTLTATGQLGGTPVGQPLTLTDTGRAPVHLTLDQVPGAFTEQGQPAAAPVQRISGHFSPLAVTRAAVRAPGREHVNQQAASSWASLPDYPIPVMDNAVAADPVTGQIYSAGGFGGGLANSGVTGDVYVYNPGSQAWTSLPPLPTPREAPAAAVLGTRLYVTGGWSGSGPDSSTDPTLEIYDPATGAWTSGTSIPNAVAGASVTVYDGQMYVIGGCTTSTCGQTSVQIYDPATDSWHRGASYPRPISWSSCGTIQARIYCAGGVSSGTVTTSAAYAYSPAANRWTSISPLPASLWGSGYAAAGGKLLVSGGIIGGFTVLTNQGFAYDPGTNAWTALPTAPAALYRGGSACGFVRVGGSNGGAGDAWVDSAEQLPGYAGCGHTAVPWLAESATALTVQPGHSVTVTVTTKPAAVSQPGTYTAGLAVGQDTPYPAAEVGVRLTATPPPDWGEITGSVTGLACHGPAEPLRGATVQVDGHGASYTLTTNNNGRYALWLSVSRNPLRLIAGSNGWQPKTRTVRITAGQVTTASFTLASASPCAAPTAGTAAAPTRPACPTAPRPGFATCLALVRTGLPRHEGLFTGATPPGYGPANLQSAYKLPSATAGRNQTVAIVDAYNDPHAEADLAVYRAQYGLPPCTTANGCFRKVAQNGSTLYPPDDPSGNWEIEESLDLDMVSAICPRCHILLVEANDTAIIDLGEAENEAVALGAGYISNSYGTTEEPNDPVLDELYFRHPGVVVTAGSGDQGYQFLGPIYPAASQYVTAVGGTTLTRDSAVPRGWTETAWALGGSGCAPYDAKPSWQHDRGCVQRMAADVSADANPDPGLAIYDTDHNSGWQVVGGTSAASPMIAATYALAGPAVTGSYPVTYPYGHARHLFDVTSGSNGTCQHWAYLCNARPGYDGPTGLGTPDGTAAFTMGPEGAVTGTVTSGHEPLAGALVSVGHYTAHTSASGTFRITVPDGSYPVTVTDFGYVTKTAAPVTVGNGQTLTRDVALTAAAQGTLSGTVRDGSGQGWPLYAQVSVPGTTAVTYTNPATGRYRLTLPAPGSYSVRVTPLDHGYALAQATVHSAAAGESHNFRLTVSPGCTAPGYQLTGTSCKPVAGGLVQGVIHDGNTGAPVSDAQVTSVSSPSEHATTSAAPQPGHYDLFSAATGPQRFTVTKHGYQRITATVSVRPHAAVTLGLGLSAGQLAVSPATVQATVRLGGSATAPVRLTNTGHAAVTVHLYQQPGDTQPPAAASRVPTQNIPGRFSPLRPTRPAGRLSGRPDAPVVPQAGLSDRPWSILPSVPAPIMDNAAATDPVTGDVYSVGGFGLAGAPVSAAYVYLPSAGAWRQLPYMRDARDAPQVAFIDGKLYVTGGWSSAGNPVGSLEIYDPATGAWSTGASDPAPYGGASVTVAGGEMYVIGGCTAIACGYNTVEIYDPATNSWHAGARYPRLVAWESCGGIGAAIYCAGGVVNNKVETKAAYAYDIAANRWRGVASLPITLWGSGYAASPGQLEISGGVTGSLATLTNRGFAYHPASDTWTPLPNANWSLYRGASACGLYRIGGSITGTSPQDLVEQLPGYGICGVTAVPWLGQSRSQLTLQPGQTATVTVTLNAHAVAQPGTYTAELAVGQDTPYPPQQVPVTLTVTPPPNWGQVTGTVSGLGCHPPAAPLSDATVQVDGRHTSYTLHTGPDGRYAWWLPVGNDPLTLIVQQDGWQPQTRTVTLKALQTTTADFTLKPVTTC